jgi:hypothetical protein
MFKALLLLYYTSQLYTIVDENDQKNEGNMERTLLKPFWAMVLSLRLTFPTTKRGYVPQDIIFMVQSLDLFSILNFLNRVEASGISFSSSHSS